MKNTKVYLFLLLFFIGLFPTLGFAQDGVFTTQWPDAFACTDSNGDIHYPRLRFNNPDGNLQYESGTATLTRFIVFNATTGAFVSEDFATATDCANDSISDLIASGQAIYYSGTSTASAQFMTDQQFLELGNSIAFIAGIFVLIAIIFLFFYVFRR